jgi:hypothetical protein
VRSGPPAEVLAGKYGWAPRVSAWKGTTLLAAEVPVVSGRYSADAEQEVPERVTLTVPEWASTSEHPGGFSWVPDGPDHPLGHYGQTVQVDVVVRSSLTGQEWVTRLGRFQVQDWDHDDLSGAVQVECVGLLQRVLDARFRVPESPRPSSTFVSEFRRLMVPGVPVAIDGALVDRPVPRSFQWPEDRLAALYELVDAWPARLRVDEQGTARLLPPLPETPIPLLTLTDGERGTVVGAPRSGGRDGVYNVVVARSSQTDDPAKAPLQAVRQVISGPLMPAVYGEVVRFWSSPLAVTTRQLDASAATLLANSIRPAVQQRVTLAHDPRVELDDPVELVRGATTGISTKTTTTGFGTQPFGTSTFGEGSTSTSTVPAEDLEITRGWVVGYDLPLTVGDGAMSVTVGVA